MYKNTWKDDTKSCDVPQVAVTSGMLLDTHSVKIWLRYVLQNTNAYHFCDIIFRHRAMFSTCPNKEIQKSSDQKPKLFSKIIDDRLVESKIDLVSVSASDVRIISDKI